MKRLIENTVFCGFVTCWRLAGAPTSRWPSFVNATTDGVVRPPSAFGITVGSPPSSTAMQLLVVPRAIPIVFAICLYSLLSDFGAENLSRNVADFGSAEDADQNTAGDDQRGAAEQARADELVPPEQECGESNAPERLRRHEGRDHGDATA